MNWTKSYESLMRSQGLEPYGCLVEGCAHISGGSFCQILHYKFGPHADAGSNP